MSNAILIIGESGAGKSSSGESLDPKDTFWTNVTGKDLPIKGFKKLYTPFTKENPNGNYLASSNTDAIIATMNHVSANRPEIKNFIIDDFQYVMSFEFMARSREKGFEKFNDIGGNAFNILQKARTLRDDLNVVILTHSDKDKDSFVKMKTIGKMLDEKITPEGLFTVVLMAEIIKDDNDKPKHIFRTHSDGNSVVKSPKGMFEDSKIDNNLKLVLDKIKEYNN
jgi:hypothetical protein